MSNPFTSERLVFRAVETPDDNDFFDKMGKDVSGYLNSSYAIGMPQSRQHVAEFQKYVSEQALLGVVCCIRQPKQSQDAQSEDELVPIGSIHLAAVKPSHRHHRNATIGIDILPEYQGQGYGSEAIQWILKWSFEMAGLHRVKIGAFGYNPGARRLYERLGFVLEGTMRDECWFQGRWYDSHMLGMLESEWRALQSKQQSAQ